MIVIVNNDAWLVTCFDQAFFKIVYGREWGHT
jgi:hypothetical protein